MRRYRVLLCEAHWTRDCCSRRGAQLRYRSAAGRNNVQLDFVKTNWSHFCAVFTYFHQLYFSSGQGRVWQEVIVTWLTLLSGHWSQEAEEIEKKNHVLLSWDSNPSSCRFDGNESIIRRYEPDFSTLWFNTNHLWHLAFVWFGEETVFWYTPVNKNPSAWNFLSPKPEVTCGTFAIIFRVVLLSPYLRIRAVSLSSIHYNQSHRVYINRRRQYICLIWN